MIERSPRERVLCTLRREAADRLPLTLDVGASAGIDSAYLDIFRRNSGAEDPAEYFDYDIRYVKTTLTPTAADFSVYYDKVPPGATFDEFGVGHVPVEDFPLGLDLHPWKSFTRPQQVWDYPFPRFEMSSDLPSSVQALKSRGYAVSAAAGSINEWCHYLRGMDEFLVDLLLRPEMAQAILERVTSLCTRLGSCLAQIGVDILCFYGDMGSQTSLLMAPATWQRWIRPRWQSILEAVRRANAQAFTFYHSCGFIEPIIPQLIELGFDILNPVQPESMDPVRIRRRYGDSIALWGGIGMQSTMMQGSSAEVRRAVRELVEAWAPGGGAIVTAAQTMLRDVPWENVTALVETVREHSRRVLSRLG